MGGLGSIPAWVGKILWRRAWQPTPVFLPREPHGQRSLASYRPWGHKESDTTEQLSIAHMDSMVTTLVGGGEKSGLFFKDGA